MKNRKKLTGARAVGLLRYLPLILWVAFFVFAFGWIVLASFSTTKEIFSNGLPRSKAISVIDFFFVPVTISCPMVDPA